MASPESLCRRVITESEFRNRVFTEPVDYRGALFTSPAKFDTVDFRGGANFQGAVFEQGAYFFDCHFTSAEFSWCRFLYQAYFWRCRFEGLLADFSQALVLKGPNPPATYLHNGEANFSWACFNADANLARLRVEGPAFFWGTRFKAAADLSDVRFDGNARFEGTPWRVCVSRQEVAEFYDQLVSIGVLHLDPETSDGRFANFVGVETVEQLLSKLNGRLPVHALEIVRQLWIDRALRMFSDQGATLTGASAAHASAVHFSGVNLNRALIADSGLAKAQFDDVEWSRRKMFGTRRRRSAVYDESLSREPRAYAIVGSFYHDIRLNYEQRNEPELARDFYYGEMETRCLSPDFSRVVRQSA